MLGVIMTKTKPELMQVDGLFDLSYVGLLNVQNLNCTFFENNSCWDDEMKHSVAR